MLLEMEKKLIAKDFQYSTRKSHKKEKSSSLWCVWPHTWSSPRRRGQFSWGVGANYHLRHTKR